MIERVIDLEFTRTAQATMVRRYLTECGAASFVKASPGWGWVTVKAEGEVAFRQAVASNPSFGVKLGPTRDEAVAPLAEPPIISPLEASDILARVRAHRDAVRLVAPEGNELPRAEFAVDAAILLRHLLYGEHRDEVRQAALRIYDHVAKLGAREGYHD